MSSKQKTDPKTAICDLLQRYPLYRFRKGQDGQYLLRVLISVETDALPAALSQILPCGQLLDTRLEVTICGGDLDDLLTSAPDLRRFVGINGTSEMESPLACLTFPRDPSTICRENWDYVLTHKDPGWPFDPEQLVAVMDDSGVCATFPDQRAGIISAPISEELLEQIAFNTHYGYQKYNAPRATLAEIEESHSNDYNRSSTLTNVMHMRSKLACCGILDDDLPTAARRFAAYMKDHPEIVGRLAVVEHNRWIMEKVLKGFRLPENPGRYFCKADDTTHSEKDHWHVCLVPCDSSHRLTADDWRAAPGRYRSELDPLDRMSLDVHHKCREIAETYREDIFADLASCKRNIEKHSGALDKATALAHLSSMHSAVSHMYQKKRIATYRFDQSKKALLNMLEGDDRNTAKRVRDNIKRIDKDYLKPLREYIIDKDYKELDYLMVQQIPFALTRKKQPVLVKFFDSGSNDCQFAPWQMEPRAVTYLGFIHDASQLPALEEKATHIRSFLRYSCNEVQDEYHVLTAPGVAVNGFNGTIQLHSLSSAASEAIEDVLEEILGKQQPDYMEMTGLCPALSVAAPRYATRKNIGIFYVDDCHMRSISNAEELEYPAPLKGITVREMFDQNGAVWGGCESAEMSDLSNVYRKFWNVSRNAKDWDAFCNFISDAYNAQKVDDEHTYTLYLADPAKAPQERTVTLNAQVLNKLLPIIREMEERQYLSGVRIEWIVGDTMKLTFQIRGTRKHEGKLPADRLAERLEEISANHTTETIYDIKWTGDKPEIQVKNLKMEKAILPSDHKDEYRQLLEKLNDAGVITGLRFDGDAATFDFTTDKFLFSLRNSGKVLEYYLYYTALQDCHFDDAEVSWSFYHSDKENSAKNELDVICTRGTTSLFISAKYVKLKRFEGTDFLNHVCYEVSNLADAFGIHAAKVLAAPNVPQFEDGKLGSSVRHALSRGVYLLGDKCFEDDNLGRVLDRIADGTEDWCQFLMDQNDTD